MKTKAIICYLVAGLCLLALIGAAGSYETGEIGAAACFLRASGASLTAWAALIVARIGKE